MDNVFEVLLLEFGRQCMFSELTICRQSMTAAAFQAHNPRQAGSTISRTIWKLKMAAELTIPDYHNQKRLPTGSTISLWDNRATIFNVDNLESTILHPANYKDVAWVDALDDITTYWFSAVTMTEYVTMLNSDGRIDKLPGSIRKPGSWEQRIMVPTSEEAIQWLAYHQSQGHTMSNNETVLIAIAFEEHNLIHHMSQKMVTSFQRGYSVQVLQVHAPYNYSMQPASDPPALQCDRQVRQVQLGERLDLALWPHNPCEDNVDYPGRFPASYNLRNGIGTPRTIWPVTIAARSTIGFGSLQGRQEDRHVSRDNPEATSARALRAQCLHQGTRQDNRPGTIRGRRGWQRDKTSQTIHRDLGQYGRLHGGLEQWLYQRPGSSGNNAIRALRKVWQQAGRTKARRCTDLPTIL